MKRITYSIDRLRQELQLVDANLETPVDIYLIGGGAMGLAGMKAATKDIDVILADPDHLHPLEAALGRSGYERPFRLEEPYAEMGAVRVYDKPDCPQWDIFVNVVCHKLRLSESMVSRATLVPQETGRLRVHVLAPSDIFIFKSITPRQADRDDMETIHTRNPLPWATVLSEMSIQSAPEKRVWTPAFVEAMEGFEARGYRVPILPDLVEIADREMGQYMVLRHLRDGSRTIEMLSRAIGEDQEWIELALHALVGKDMVIKRGEAYVVPPKGS